MMAREGSREKTLGDLRGDIARAGGWIAGGIVIATALAVVFIYMAVPAYRARMIVSPASGMDGAAVSAMGAGDDFLGLRYMAQRGGFSGDADFLRFENMLRGASVARELLQDEKIVRGLSFDRAFTVSLFDGPRPAWTPEGLADYIEKRVRIEPVGGTALRRLVYLHPNPEFAVYLLHRLQRVTDEMIRTAVRADAGARVDYLQRAIAETVNPEHRRALTALLMEQERLKMLASIDQPYAAAVVEPPSASPRAWWPDALLIVPSLMFAGALLGLVLHGLFRPAPAVRQDVFAAGRGAWFVQKGINSNERRLRRPRAVE